MGSFGFFLPLSLLAIVPIIAVLVWAFRRHGKGTPTTIGTLFLFDRLSEKPAFRQQFKPPLRFFFELLLLSLLLLAFAGPFFRDTSEEITYLLDNSLSMAARLKSSEKSRLETAKDEVRSRFASLSSRATFSLFKSSPRLEVVASHVSSASELDAALARIRPEYADDNLSDAVTKLRVKYPNHGLRIVSDRLPAEKVEGPPSEDYQLISVVSPSESLENVAVARAQIIRANDSESLMLVKVQTYLKQAATVQLNIFRLVSVSAKIQEVRVRTFDEEFESGSDSRDIEIQNIDPSYAYRISVSIEGERDKFPFDDSFWVTEQNSPVSGVIVSSRSAKALGVSEIFGKGVNVLAPDTVDKFKEKPDWIVFDRLPVLTLPESPSIHILPSVESSVIRVQPLSPVIVFSSWESEHPLFRYLNFSAFTLKGASTLETPPWTRSLLRTADGSILAAGEYRGNRHVFVGFEIFPLSPAKNPIGTVLFLNALQWLSAGDLQFSGPAVGIPFRVADGLEDIALYDGQAVVPLSKLKSGQLLVPRPGYVYSRESSREGRYAVNFFSAQESRLNSPSYLELPLPTESLKHIEESELQFELWRWLVWGVIVLLVLERFVSLFRGRASLS